MSSFYEFLDEFGRGFEPTDIFLHVNTWKRVRVAASISCRSVFECLVLMACASDAAFTPVLMSGRPMFESNVASLTLSWERWSNSSLIVVWFHSFGDARVSVSYPVDSFSLQEIRGCIPWIPEHIRLWHSTTPNIEG